MLLQSSNHEAVPILASNCDDYCLKSRNVLIIRSAEDWQADRITQFILNRGQSAELSESPTKALLVFDLNEQTGSQAVFNSSKRY